MTRPRLPRVLVTRPREQADAWVHDLRERGLEAVALPLISILPVEDSSALHSAWARLGSFDAVMFVSATAVSFFFASATHERRLAWCDGTFGTRAWSTGPGTSAALRRAGLDPVRIDAPDASAGQFDSEALWACVAHQVRAGAHVLIVRGADENGDPAGRDWLARQLTAAGAQVEQVMAYRRAAPELDGAQVALVQDAAVDGSVWLFSSSEAVGNLLLRAQGQDWSRARAVATHPRIATTVRQAGFAAVACVRPAIDDVVASIESIA